MANIEKIEDLNAWKEARSLVKCVYQICKRPELSREHALVDQLKRSSLSISANIAEGFGRFGLRDSRNFYVMARGSLIETKSHLYTILDIGFVSQKDFDEVNRRMNIVGKLLSGLISNSLRYQEVKKEVNK